MKIGLFTDTFYPEINGVATSCLTLERELTKRGHEVHVFAPKCKGWEDNQRENIHYLTSKPFVALKDRNIAIPTPNISQEATSIDFDVVHTNSEFVMGYFGRYVADTLGCAIVHTYHTIWEDYTYYLTHGVADDTVRRITRKYSQWWCNRVDRVITPTEKTLDLLRQYGVDAPIDVIPSGMDIARFSPERHDHQERMDARRECGLPENKRLLLNIGRIAREKNLDQIMRVFPKLLEVCPDVHFAIVGEGPLREDLRRMAEELGVSDSVTLVGPKPWEKIDRYYAMGDVFCSASHSETQGLTYVEAMASGLCVCAVNDPCLNGVIEDGVSGILSGTATRSCWRHWFARLATKDGALPRLPPITPSRLARRRLPKRLKSATARRLRIIGYEHPGTALRLAGYRIRGFSERTRPEYPAGAVHRRAHAQYA